MKHLSFIAALLLTAGLLAGCGAPAASASSVSSSAAPSAPAASASVSASSAASEPQSEPAVSNRPASIDLVIGVEGTAETVRASLFVGDGYSIYLPDGEWRQFLQSSRTADSFVADAFAATSNEAVTLVIQPNYNSLPHGDMTLEEAYDALLSEGYNQSDDNDHLFSQSADGTTTCQYVTESGGVVWYVAWSYPDTPEYTEGWGSRLPQIAATFEADGAGEGAQ